MRNLFKMVSVVQMVLLVAVVMILDAQAQPKGTRASLKASVSQTIGEDTQITIVYSRPGVKGRKIWGDLVPYGFAPGNQYSNNQPIPWRAGANETTIFEVSKDVRINGQNLAAGKYGIHMIPGEKEWSIMFNSEVAWGSFSYKKDKDVLTIKVTPTMAPHQEWLRYGFEDLAGTSATAYLHWEKLMVPFKVEAAEMATTSK